MSDTNGTQAAQKSRIIVIDDSRLVRASLSNVLSEEFEIIEAVDGEEGWEKLVADSQIQVVLTDAGMPRLNGYELIERIRAHSETRVKQIPVIMITAADDEKSRQHALELGATDFITKPFDKAQLLARVRAQATLDQTTRNLAETTEALVEHATDDPLTGVGSRRYFLKRGEQDLAFATRHKGELAIVVASIDNYEGIKQEHGQKAADSLLAPLAKILKKRIRTEDTLARIGDDHFAILAPTLGQPEAISVCERIRQQVGAYAFTHEGVQLPLTVSIGLVSHGIDTATNVEEYLALAEKHAAAAQQAGGNQVHYNKPTTEQTSKKRISIDAAMLILEKGNTEKIAPHAKRIVEQLLPLLEFCNESHHLGIEVQIRAIKQKLVG